MKQTLAVLAAISALALTSVTADAASNKSSKVYAKASSIDVSAKNPFGTAAQSLVQRGHATAGDGRAVWRRDGIYEFHSNKGQSYKGKWRVVGDQICVTYTSGYSRCDEIRRLGGGWDLITQYGEHYPLR
jgi:hypothetical protein